MNLRPRHREDPEINLISLIDILLVLLIFFMVSTTFNQEGRVKVQLPQASDIPQQRSSREPLVITVTAEGTYRVNERPLINSSADTLRAALLKEAGQRGIGRFEANLVIASVEHELGRVGRQALTLNSRRPLWIGGIALFVVVQSAVAVGLWELLHS